LLLPSPQQQGFSKVKCFYCPSPTETEAEAEKHGNKLCFNACGASN